jgi:hypothetical protein
MNIAALGCFEYLVHDNAAVFGENVHNEPQPSVKESFMRSEILFEALHTTNRFALCHLAFKAIRKLHRPNNRIQDTATDALQRLAGAEQQKNSIAPENATDVPAIEVGLEQPAIAS